MNDYIFLAVFCMLLLLGYIFSYSYVTNKHDPLEYIRFITNFITNNSIV